MSANSSLFKPLQIHNLILKNRITMTPLYVGYANLDGSVNDLVLEHYREMASSGAAMIVVENAAVNTIGSGAPFVIRADEDRFMEGLSKLATVIKEQSAVAIQQINHSGKFAFSPEPLAPSDGPEGSHYRSMTLEEIAIAVADYAMAATRVKEAGFDGVEIHGGTGYLIDQFLSPLSNQRIDQYGGSLENRMRFSLQVFDEIRAAVGPDFPIGYRFLADEALPGGWTLEESAVWAVELEKRNVAYLSVMYGTYESFFVPEYIENERKEGYMASWAGEIKKVVPNTPVIAAGRIQSPKTAIRVLDEGTADLIGMARVLLADPLWPQKVAGQITSPIVACKNTCTACMKRVMSGKPVFCARWDKERRSAFLLKLGEKPEEVDQSTE